MDKQLVSPGNRPINYLRISVTDRCDMRCTYCMPAIGQPFLDRPDYLTEDEIVRVVGVAADLGVFKIRLTGGEPLVRPGMVDLVRRIAAVPGIREVALSTNASKLARYALPLATAGLRRVNISLDSLNARRFAEITRGGSLQRTLDGIEAAEKAGLTPIKINTVVMRGLNYDEVPDLVEMGARRGWQVRFIEYMPIGSAEGIWDQHFVPAPEILASIQERFTLEPLPIRSGDPARLFRVQGTKATVGVITPITQHFCDSCNRMRLTADGRIRSCLLVNGEQSLRDMMRAGCSDHEMVAVLQQVAIMKPEWHGVVPGAFSTATDAMREIGG